MKGAFGKGHKHGRWADMAGGPGQKMCPLTEPTFTARQAVYWCI